MGIHKPWFTEGTCHLSLGEAVFMPFLTFTESTGFSVFKQDPRHAVFPDYGTARYSSGGVPNVQFFYDLSTFDSIPRSNWNSSC